MLVKGILLFFTFGLLFFLVITSLEYFLWLNSTGRLILLLVFIAVEAFFIVPLYFSALLFLFKLKRGGISNRDASVLIGRHFPEVGDKLSNLLELAQNRDKSELVMASMEQRSLNLSPIPFSRA